MKFPDLKLQAWMNKKFSPELLEHKTPIMDCILEQIKEMASFKFMDSLYPSTTLTLWTCKVNYLSTRVHYSSPVLTFDIE